MDYIYIICVYARKARECKCIRIYSSHIVFIRSVAEYDPSPTYIVVGKLFRPCHSVHVLLFLPV